ncbi:hypothetical protein [Sporomusa acidovorans]|uniref:hypothetical protein n=1 Tax=Sporomusa acidovorans TaxID=112900 RepID=UPI00146D7A17|nr:hypothetical protein [Sporomusa acidovorans]
MAKAEVKRQWWSVVNAPPACAAIFFNAEYIALKKPEKRSLIDRSFTYSDNTGLS